MWHQIGASTVVLPDTYSSSLGIIRGVPTCQTNCRNYGAPTVCKQEKCSCCFIQTVIFILYLVISRKRLTRVTVVLSIYSFLVDNFALSFSLFRLLKYIYIYDVLTSTLIILSIIFNMYHQGQPKADVFKSLVCKLTTYKKYTYIENKSRKFLCSEA